MVSESFPVITRPLDVNLASVLLAAGSISVIAAGFTAL